MNGLFQDFKWGTTFEPPVTRTVAGEEFIKYPQASYSPVIRHGLPPSQESWCQRLLEAFKWKFKYI